MDKEISKEFEKVWKAIKLLQPNGGRDNPVIIKSKKSKSIYDLVLELKQEGFFDKPRSLNEIQDKLASKTYHYPASSLTDPIKRLVRAGELGRIKKEGAWHYAKR